MLAGIHAVLFDLDGTLVDSVPDITVAVDGMLADLGRPPAGEVRVRLWVGDGGRMLVRRALAGNDQGIADDDPVMAAAMRIFFAHYTRSNGIASRLYPGVRETLDGLRARGLPMATVTNKPARFVAPLYIRLGILEHFAHLVGGDTLPLRKPDPAPVWLACKRLGVAPGNALMVGDSCNDIDAAGAAGCPVVAVDYGYNHGRPLAGVAPDRILSDLRALL